MDVFVLWFGFIVFTLGAIAGSAANAFIYRLPRNISWFVGRSQCTHCKHELHVLDLVPILSYLFLGGSCRYCKKPIGIRYLAVELWIAAGFLLLFLTHGITEFIFLAIIFWVTTVIAVMDWETKLVSEHLVIIWGGVVILQGLVFGNLISISTLIGLLVCVGLIGGVWLFSKGKGMGFGDVEISVVMGLWLGWPKSALALWIGFVTGAVYGLFLLSSSKGTLKSEVAFGPFLILGAWMGYILNPWTLLPSIFSM